MLRRLPRFAVGADRDSFLEDHILESGFHRIRIEGRQVGAFAIRNHTLLTITF